MTGYSDWQYAILCKRLSHVAAQRDYWRNCIEMYAWEAQHFWSPV